MGEEGEGGGREEEVFGRFSGGKLMFGEGYGRKGVRRRERERGRGGEGERERGREGERERGQTNEGFSFQI